MKLVLTNISNAMMLKRLSLWAFMLTTISCCLWTTGVYADPGASPEFKLEETIQGGPCMTDFSVTDVGDCCYHFEDLTPGGDPNCPKWEIFDALGNLMVTAPGQVFDFCFPASGMYVVCYHDCCVMADGTIMQDTVCKDLDINCEGCVPDALFSVTDIGDCCYHFEDLTPEFDPNDPCDHWDIYDAGGNPIGAGIGEFFDFCFPVSGVYQICYHDCCVNSDGTITDHLHCIDLEVDCGGCEVDPFFQIQDLGDCCYHFEDLTPDPNGSNCQAWDITDAFGNVVSTGLGFAHDYCFLTSGTYTICYTDCCINADGTMTTATHCETIDVECECLPYDLASPVVSAISHMDCFTTTMLISISPADGYCIDWIFEGLTYTAIFDAALNAYTVSFPTPCPGEYEGEALIYCCDNPATAVSLFIPLTIDIDCCCIPDATFSTTDLGDCCYHFEDLTPDPFGNNCSQWEVTDQFGNVLVTGHFGQFLDYCFPTGVYTICYTDCCTRPDGTQVFDTHCETIEVDCGCEVDALFSITDLGDCCYHFEDLTPDPLGNNCSQWDITDAFGNSVLTGVFGPMMDHCFMANGVYTICYTDCCTQPDGTIIYATHCETIEIECACTPDPLFSVTDQGDCCYRFVDLTPELDPNDPCDTWEIYDPLGTVISAGFGEVWDFCFPSSGMYVICYTDCCINADGTVTALTHCIDLLVDCCTADATFSHDMVDDCCYVFSDLTPEPDSPNDPCDNWEIFDSLGNVIATANGDIFTYCFTTSGSYVICHTDCCINSDGTITQDVQCIDLFVDCACTPDPLFSAEPLADCCYHFEDLTPEFDPNDPCDIWEVFDALGNVIATANGEFYDFCFPGSGTYVVCYTDCCINADGTITSLTHCIDISVDCCTADATFTYDMIDDCCYVFTDLTPEPDSSNDPCDNWEIFDAFGNVVATTQGDIFTYCFLTSGSYVICHTDCCVNADGTMTQDVHCIDLFVDCGCTPDPLFSAEPLADCCYHFEDLTPEFDPNDPCDLWEVYDALGNVIATANGEFYDFCFPGSGTYVVCHTDCCINADGTITSLTHCIDIFVDCCTADATFTYDMVDDCCYVFSDLTPEPDSPNDPCDNWEIFDAFGNVIATTQGDIFTYCFTASGTYVICHTDCCLNSDGTMTVDTQCIDLVVDCGCEVPDFVSFTYFGTSGPDCQAGFCLDQILDPTKYCSTWYWGDGSQSDHPVDECPVHNYDCDGIYDVCVDVYCCEDPTVRVTSCQTVEVDCECNLATGVDFFTLVNADDCSVSTILNLPIIPCPDEICWSWDMGDGFTQVGGVVNHTYVASGTYTICLYVFCCDDPTNGYTVCHDVIVNCCTVPDAISFTYFGSWGPDCESGFCLDQVLDPAKYCSTWYWGDGSQSDHPVDECPVHYYECDGIYDVCVDVYCCEDPSVRVTSCQVIEVDCDCNLPTDVDFDILVNADDCSISTFITMPNVTCPDEICWSWDMGDGFTQVGGTTVNHTYAMSGTYTICLNVYCCDEPAVGYVVCHEVTVDCPPCTLPSFIDFEYTVDMCTVSVVGIESDDYDGNLCYSWNWGDGTLDTPGQIATHTYAASGTYTVCYTVYCCADPSVSMTVCHDITVECPGDCPKPCELHSRFLWEMFPITQADGCCMQFFDVSVPGAFTTITSWHWDFGDGNTSTSQNPLHCYDTPGSHTVCLTITGFSPDGQCEDVFCWEVLCDCEDTCPGDLTGDGQVDLSDLLAFLGMYGSICP